MANSNPKRFYDQADPRMKLRLSNGMDKLTQDRVYHQHRHQSKYLLIWKILPVIGDVLSSLINVTYASSVWNIKLPFRK